MLRRLMTAFATAAVAFLAATGIAFAAVDVNTADQAQLESIKGIGPAISARIIAERKKGNFKDWADLETRVSGVGDRNAVKYSEAGLTVGGQAKSNASAMSQSTTSKTTTKSAVVPPSLDMNSKTTTKASTAPAAGTTGTATGSTMGSASRSTIANPRSDAIDTKSVKTTTMTKGGKGGNDAAMTTETKGASKSKKGDTASTESTPTSTKK